MTKQAQKYIKENIPYYSKIPSDTQRGKDTLRKKAWVITSEYVRMRDFIEYKYCVSCKKYIENWRMTDPAHYYTFAGNGALLGFNLMNIHMSCKFCNGFRGAVAGHEMGEEIVVRYGEEILKDLARLKNMTVKADDFFFINIIETTLYSFNQLKEKYPDFEYPSYVA